MSEPLSRNEAILRATIDGQPYNKAPLSREEALLLELKEAIEAGGGGGGGGEGMKFEKVDSLPAYGNSHTIYFVKSGVAGDKDVYKEYVYLDGSWERLGQYEGNIDYDAIGDKPDAVPDSFIDSLFD